MAIRAAGGVTEGRSPIRDDDTILSTHFCTEAAGRALLVVDKNHGVICSHLEVEKALWASMGLIDRHIGGDQLFLELYEFDKGVVRVVATATAEKGELCDTIIPMPKEAVVQAEDVDSFGVIVVNDPEKNPVARAMNRAVGQEGSTCLVLPLHVQNIPVGLLVLARHQGEPFLQADAELFQMLNEPFAIALTNALRHAELQRLKDQLQGQNRFLQRELRSLVGGEIIGADFGLRGVMEAVRQVAPKDTPVLLLGETGVGKDVIASALHRFSSRREGPLIKVNSGAIPEALIDSELFGHEKGAFTGALSQKRGRFERAHRGTLFLDEIGELPPPAQVRLLRVLQNGEIERVGGTEPLKVDVRIISATHRDLPAMVREGTFREDLWFRLNVLPIHIPPLRQRREDIRALVHHLLHRKSRDLKLGSPPELGPGAMDMLLSYSWPGNVREVENVIERALILHRGGPLYIDQLLGVSPEPTRPSLPRPLDSETGSLATLDQAVVDHIHRALAETGGKIHGPGGAAELLGVKATTLRYRMDKLGVTYKKRQKSGHWE